MQQFQYLLARVLQKIPLHIIPFVVGKHLPYQMEMVGHDNKTIYCNALVFDKETQIVGDVVFELVFFKQRLPLQAVYGEEVCCLA